MFPFARVTTNIWLVHSSRIILDVEGMILCFQIAGLGCCLHRRRTQRTYSVSTDISWVCGKRHETRRFPSSKSMDSSMNYSKPEFLPSCKPRQNYLQQRQSADIARETNRSWKWRQQRLTWLSRDALPYAQMMCSCVTGSDRLLKWPLLVFGPSEWLNCSTK